MRKLFLGYKPLPLVNFYFATTCTSQIFLAFSILTAINLIWEHLCKNISTKPFRPAGFNGR